MEISHLTPVDVSPALNNANSPDAFAQEQAAKEFESVFVSLLLKEMRNTLSEGFFGEESSDVLGGMFDQYMGQHISSAAQFGIQELVQAQQSLNLGATIPQPTVPDTAESEI